MNKQEVKRDETPGMLRRVNWSNNYRSLKGTWRPLSLENTIPEELDSRQLLTNTHGVTSQKTLNFSNTAVRAS